MLWVQHVPGCFLRMQLHAFSLSAVINTNTRGYTESTRSRRIYTGAEDVWEAANAACVGYGHRLRTRCMSEAGSEESSISMQPPELFMQALDSNGEFQDQYVFAFHDTQFAEFEMLNWYTSTCPEANHLMNVVVAKQTPQGRHTYNGQEFKSFTGTKLAWSKRPQSDAEVYRYLQELFSLNFVS